MKTSTILIWCHQHFRRTVSISINAQIERTPSTEQLTHNNNTIQYNAINTIQSIQQWSWKKNNSKAYFTRDIYSALQLNHAMKFMVRVIFMWNQNCAHAYNIQYRSCSIHFKNIPQRFTHNFICTHNWPS